MAFITYPLNMVDYTAEDAELFHCTRNSGIYADNDFQCIASGVDNTITVGEGIGWIRNSKYSGKVFANKTAEVVDLGLADASLPRYDVVAVQFNKAQNLTKIVVKNGTPESNPIIPERSVTESIYELYLCKVYRPVGALTITADNVTDTRLDAELCGLMGDSVTRVDTYAIDAQIKALIDNLEAEIQGVKDASGLMHTSEWVENGTIPIRKGGTGADNTEGARKNLGLTDPEIGLKAYPVGSVYISNVDTDPALLFGGTWTQLYDLFPYFSKTTGVGGANTYKLSAGQLPSHSHELGTTTNHAVWTTSDSSTSADIGGNLSGEGFKFPRALSSATIARIHETNAFGEGLSIDNMPRYKSFYAWYRKA